MPPASRNRALLALALSVPATSLGSTLAYAVVPGPIGQSLYMLLRAWLALFPLVWLLRVERGTVSWSPLPRARRREAWVATLVLSLVVVVVIFAAWELVGRDWFDVERLRRQAADSGLGSRANYVLFGAFIALVNSLMEEYVWRWFVYRRCEELVGALAAVPLAALLFTLHHILTFTLQFGLSAGLLASLGVFLAGCAWSACYLRWRSIWPGWVTHVVADLAGLAIGWRILFGE
ncbi:MAG: CPBP family intramembrane metalloprotease [Planctomycetes bacterium]|nr:CPBP family intramembrane metalloprotease [Planctomycetota bacterium]